ncbi:MAG: YebC/PmpR family DNA-binding transcriptional regulator [Chloroflexota bacterium]|nr:YebC/PmpR family DNA-binding transcriptional regulator [Chloroflexota bacterium]MDE2988987.1 YebC/PmpR family DNA-binding transcriptional regulator [Chloroflexota bacterium]MXX48376.1 YebC/PmpR family DNA-binding transcriptional regulator [Chloroflexota bacterium]MYA00821.1 YebC/PmpR family DNA-binding transcriptional regulator [Chloroflexota bacterium]MYJ57813.1 YebC/PmpR family DNA-binding transcriptional regulator [Chloroflexota bacterium]
MAGHSKWAQIKRKKGVTDAKRGQLFTKLGREIAVAVRSGGPKPEENSALRLAVERARASNMPNANIQRAIDRASGGGDGSQLEEIRYEAYGPGGAALLIDSLTDNRNRTVSEVRAALTRAGTGIAESGAVAWLFEQKGVIAVDVDEQLDPDDIMLAAIDGGAEDVDVDEGLVEVITAPADLESARSAVEEAGAPIASAEVVMRATNTVPVDTDQAGKLMRLIDSLEDLDDVQRVFTNADFPDAALVEA